MLWPRGGSSSTVTRNSPASSLRAEQRGRRAGGEAGAARRARRGPARAGATRRGAALGRVPVDRLAHRADVLGRRPAAAADHARARRDHPRRVVRHVGRRGQVHQPLAHPARQARVGLDRPAGRPPASGTICSRTSKSTLEPTEQLAPTAWTGSPRSVRATSAAAAADEGDALVGEGQLGDDRQVGERADRLHRQPHLDEVREGLDRRSASTPPSSSPSACSRNAARASSRLDGAERRQVLAERADRAQHEARRGPCSRARRARAWRPRRLISRTLRREPVDAQLEAVGAEGVGLDAVGAGRDVLGVNAPATSLGSLRLSTSKQASSATRRARRAAVPMAPSHRSGRSREAGEEGRGHGPHASRRPGGGGRRAQRSARSRSRTRATTWSGPSAVVSTVRSAWR